jgi:hypothetical protein
LRKFTEKVNKAPVFKPGDVRHRGFSSLSNYSKILVAVMDVRVKKSVFLRLSLILNILYVENCGFCPKSSFRVALHPLGISVRKCQLPILGKFSRRYLDVSNFNG